jgi:glycosyltransferase involved in cell wall biosynthesis
MSAIQTILDSASQAARKPLHVVHVVLSLDVGGLERVVLSLVSRAQSLQQTVSVICLERRGDLALECEKLGATIYCMNKKSGIRPGIIKLIAELLKKIRPDVVHTHQIGALLYAGRAAKRAGITAVVHTEHGKHYARRFRTRMLGRIAGRGTQRFFCVSSDIAVEVADWRVVPPEKIGVVHNGIDIEPPISVAEIHAVRNELGIPTAASVIGTVGRLSDIKRQDVLIRALGKIRRVNPNVHLLLVGDGPRKDDLIKLAWRLGLADTVHFPGYRTQPRRYLAAMDVFALSSDSEGMPLAVLEAWSVHRPVAAFRVGGLPEMIEHRRSGILVTPGHETELAEALAELISNRKLAADLATEGLRRLESEFNLARTAQRYDDEYRSLTGGGDQGADR